MHHGQWNHGVVSFGCCDPRVKAALKVHIYDGCIAMGTFAGKMEYLVFIHWY
eukprot:m.747068 g.747068  ORF g.747068 m.747068 type:complete len:52 (+) comp23143_c0_seq2:2025-2180(+)